MKKFYGGKFLDKLKLEEQGIFYPIKLEYYKRIEEESKTKQKSFGISIVKTEYIKDNVKIETKEVKNLSNDERKIEKLLSMFKEFDVTPVSVDYLINDLKSNI